jgi:hypothetical protein
LGSWVIKQRSKKDKLTPDKINRLNGLGFVWDKFQFQWEAGFKHLVNYKEEFGDCLVKRGHLYHDYNLATWVGSQRSKKDKLAPDQVNRLNELGFVWKRNKPPQN